MHIVHVGNGMAEKLKALLADPVENECQVVYILVEIRKILESAGIPASSYPTLRMLCN